MSNVASAPKSPRYRDIVDMLFAERRVEQQYPIVTMTMPSLQELADKLSSRVSWLRPVTLILAEDPDESHDQKVRSIFSDSCSPGRVPKATIVQEVLDMSTPCIDAQPDIYFFDRRFLTVGVLLHELAHLHPPFYDHGDDFVKAKMALCWEFERMRWGV